MFFYFLFAKGSKRIANALLFLISVMTLSGCGEKNTDIPSEVYILWSGGKPPNGVHLIRGRYWQSSHWSKEYIMYLKLQAPELWRRNFIKQNHLVYLKDTSLAPDPDVPDWFRPTNKDKVYVPSGFNQGSVYYEDTVTGTMFLHEVQL
jgi:hypothetical protein